MTGLPSSSAGVAVTLPGALLAGPLDARLRSEERLRLLLDATRAGIVDAHVASSETYVSARFDEIMGCAPGAGPRSLHAFVRRVLLEDRPRVLDQIRESLRRGQPHVIECQICDAHGDRKWLHLRGEVLLDAAGRAERILGTVVDITDRVRQDNERQRLETEGHHAQKLESLGLLAGGIAHDFNNLLVGVLSNASLALLDLDPDSPARDVVLEIESTAQRAAELTRQLLAYSGKGRFVVEPLTLSDLITEMTPLLHSVTSKSATLQLELDPELPPMRGDASQLRQVIVNLITNASDALLGKSGSITVRTARGVATSLDTKHPQFGELAANTETVCLEVIDSGCGMSRATADRIFDPFFTTKFTGRGLGLAATLGIVCGHQGRISVRTAPDEGTSILLEFPVAELAARPARAAADDHRPSGHGTVLVVDDDRVVRGVCTALLSRRGYAVESAESGRDALDRLAQRTEPFVFVLLDLTMPGLSGIEVLREVREHERAEDRVPVTVFLMSGYSEQDVSSGLGDLTIAGFLQKPFTISDLDALLSSLDPD